MPLPPELQNILTEARFALDQRVPFDQIARYRFAVYAFFDALPGLQGRMTRTYLALRATERVLHVWDTWSEKMGGYETMPKLMLGVSKQLLAAMKEGATPSHLDALAKEITVEVIVGAEIAPGERFTRTAEDLCAEAQEMDSLTAESPESLLYPAWCVFMAAMNTLADALGWGESVEHLMAEINDWGGDAVKWAAIAYAPGRWTECERQSYVEFAPQGTWDYSSPEVDAKRREFWVWWFLEIVPETYAFLKHPTG